MSGFTEQIIDALAPSNFVLTNPKVLHETLNRRGMNLLDGLAHLLRDLDEADGYPLFRMTDPTAFRIGKTSQTRQGMSFTRMI